MQHKKHSNSLVLYRLRMGFSKKYVSALLKHKNTSVISKLEQGRALPTLPTALKLAVIYRIPVDFLYEAMYSNTRNEIRSRESRLQREPRQLTLL
jgi:transcriptional regulator with XRE-family HTH domain